MLLLCDTPRANRDAFLMSFGMVSMAEVFDKTWFVALVMAMRHEKHTVYWGCFAALLVHVFIAAAFGYSVAQLLTPRQLDFLAAALYGMFAVLYGYDWYTTDKDSDLMAAGKEEVASSMREEGPGSEEAGQYGAVQGQSAPPNRVRLGRVFCQCYMAVFVAEWGDRTQIAMIGIHASQPLVPVMLGSTLAFGLLTLSAVLVGTFLGGRTLPESTVKAVCATSFAVFALLALRDAWTLTGYEAVGSRPLV
mmetsp:Transcript_14762/g.46456  ORF Transcript_14762/g.46456 Transcript_14762/m.46456 type:complete len:249 (+) Transcript_14762:98-844(+)